MWPAVTMNVCREQVLRSCWAFFRVNEQHVQNAFSVCPSRHLPMRLRKSFRKKQPIPRRHEACGFIRRFSQIRRLIPVWHYKSQCWKCGRDLDRVKKEKAQMLLNEIAYYWTKVPMVRCSKLSQMFVFIKIWHVPFNQPTVQICTQQKGSHFTRDLCWGRLFLTAELVRGLKYGTTTVHLLH